MNTVLRSPCVHSPSALRWCSQEPRKKFDRTPLGRVREIPGHTFGPSILNRKPPPAPMTTIAGLKERISDAYQSLESSLRGIENRSFEKVNVADNDKPEIANYRVQHELRSSTRSRFLDGHIQALIVGGFASIALLICVIRRCYATPAPKDRYSEY